MTEAEKDHQAWIMGRTETFLEPFFQALNDPELMDARLIEWAEVLAPLSARDINAAMVDYHRNGPRSGKDKLLKPAVGDIYRLGVRLRDQRRRAAGVGFADPYKTREPQGPKEPRVTAEQKAQIMAEAYPPEEKSDLGKHKRMPEQ